MTIINWISDNYIELFGAVSGIVYVFLEIRQRIWLWPVGIITSAVYILVFFSSKFYADMSLQVYYLGISLLGWYWWKKGAGRASASLSTKGDGLKIEGERGRERDSATQEVGDNEPEGLVVTRLKLKTGVLLAILFIILYGLMWVVLTKFTDSPVPSWDAFITSLSVVATWMLARKIYEHWFLWIVVNFVSAVIFMVKGLYPTLVLYIVYGIMSFAGLVAWKKSISNDSEKFKIINHE
jgi:nicotinamide mononucleotide transporter